MQYNLEKKKNELCMEQNMSFSPVSQIVSEAVLKDSKSFSVFQKA